MGPSPACTGDRPSSARRKSEEAAQQGTSAWGAVDGIDAELLLPLVQQGHQGAAFARWVSTE